MSIMIVFYNVDEFKKKVQSIDLNVCFPDWVWGNIFYRATHFVREKFESCINNRDVSSFLLLHPSPLPSFSPFLLSL